MTFRCEGCGEWLDAFQVTDGAHPVEVVYDYTETGMAHAEGCYGDCEKWGCPVPVPIPAQSVEQVPCGPVVAVNPQEEGTHAQPNQPQEGGPE